MEKACLVNRKFVPIHDDMQALEFTVGIVFKSDVKPELIPGATLKIGEFYSWNPNGEDGKPRKFYARHISGTSALYAPFRLEMYAELVLRRATRESNFLFGRMGEKKPFTFGERDHLPLRIYRNSKASPNWHFNPLFIRVGNHSDIRLCKISIDWLIKDKIMVHFLRPDNLPKFFSVV